MADDPGGLDWLDEAGLRRIHGAPGPASLRKVADRITPDYRRWIEASRFAVLATVGPEGVDASPRGHDGPVARLLSPEVIALPDWRGNDRIDSLLNIVRDPRASVMFVVRGAPNVIRVNGRARVTEDAALRESFTHGGNLPRTVIVVTVAEVYFQCARAVIRAGLWSGADDSAGLPTMGEILAGLTEGTVGGAEYDRAWPERAARTMW